MDAERELIANENDKGYEVFIVKDDEPWIQAFTQGGHDFTQVPVRTVLEWVRRNRPDMMDVRGQEVES